MIYLDSNVFISAALYDEDIGPLARKVLNLIRLGKVEACTSTLTFDEVYWIVKREKGKDNALKIVKAMLKMRNLSFLPVDKEVIWRTYELLSEYDLGPRDGIHLACALIGKANMMVTEDAHFERVGLIERASIEGFLGNNMITPKKKD